MMANVTVEQEAELKEAGFDPGTVARAQYEHCRDEGKMDHKTALRRVVDGVAKLKSDSFSEEELKALRHFIKKIPGQFF